MKRLVVRRCQPQLFRTMAGQQQWSETLSFATPEADFTAQSSLASPPLPTNLAQALLEEKNACVVTTATAPHTIVHVNEAWEQLCGFSKVEALHESLRLIQGPETNRTLLQHMVDQVLETETEQNAFVRNYTKKGKVFTNHLRAKLVREENGVEYLVGFLQQVQQVPLSMRTTRILA